MSLILVIISLLSRPIEPVGNVITDTEEVEAVFIPAGFTGPVIAIPSDVEVF